MPKFELSLIICTRDRADALRRCLRAVADSDLRLFSAELVVVDNGSSDGTAVVLEDFVREEPLSVRAVYEPVAGLSKARNAGIRVAQGSILAFTDDDCYLEAGYGAALLAAFARNDIDYCGGRILRFDSSDADYVCNTKDRFESIRPRSFIPAGRIQGANMAFSRRVVDTVGPFDTRLGAGTSFRCEDVDYIARASMAGFIGAHIPEIVVYHHHGRKPGADIENLSRANDFARGAYYMKQILSGHFTFLPNWMRTTYQSRSWAVPHRFSHEFRGALAYLRANIGKKGT